jgi:hypothetical protein
MKKCLKFIITFLGAWVLFVAFAPDAVFDLVFPPTEAPTEAPTEDLMEQEEGVVRHTGLSATVLGDIELGFYDDFVRNGWLLEMTPDYENPFGDYLCEMTDVFGIGEGVTVMPCEIRICEFSGGKVIVTNGWVFTWQSHEWRLVEW